MTHLAPRTREKRVLIQSILDSLSAHVAVLDEEARIILVNNAWRLFAETNGMNTPQWGLGVNYLEICEKAAGPNSQEALRVGQAIRSILNGDIDSYFQEYPCHSPTEKRWFQVRLSAFRENTEKRVVVVHENITEVKLAAEELRESEERFSAIFRSVQELIAIKDCTLSYVLVNPAFERVVGIRSETILGKKDQEIFGKEAGDHIEDVDRRVLNGETIEEVFERPVSGTVMTFHDTRVPLRDVNGNTVGICIVSRDITHQRRISEIPQRTLNEEYKSKAMRDVFSKAFRAAATDATVLLLGESGCGKDYLARWIHEHSRRSSRPFFALNCAAISKELAESELFGHEPGAFTGARTRKRGLFELAEGGTLLLNEIGELPLSLQAKLLTFLDSKSFLRVGGDKHIRIDARIIAATHRNLETEIAEGRFIEPLFYRLNVFMIRLPPLRERTEDIPLLVKQILRQLVIELQLEDNPIVDEFFLRQLRNYSWLGNVRELRNVLERALIVSSGKPLRLDLPNEGFGREKAVKVNMESGRTLEQILDDVRTLVISEALRKNDLHAEKAAKMIGISRDAIYRYFKKLGMKPPLRSRQS